MLVSVKVTKLEQRSRGHNDNVSSQPKGQEKASNEFEVLTLSSQQPQPAQLLASVLAHAL